MSKVRGILYRPITTSEGRLRGEIEVESDDTFFAALAKSGVFNVVDGEFDGVKKTVEPDEPTEEEAVEEHSAISQEIENSPLADDGSEDDDSEDEDGDDSPVSFTDL